MDDFNLRLRALNKPLDLSISQETLNANTAMFQGRQLPVAPSAAAARAGKRWPLVDVVDVQDISGRTAPTALPEPGLAGELVDEVLPALGTSEAAPIAAKRRSREHLPWVEELDLAAERAEAARLAQAGLRAQALAQRLQVCQDEAASACQALQQQALQGWAQAERESQALAGRLRWPLLIEASLPQAQARIADWRSELGEALVRADSLADHALKEQQRTLQRQAQALGLQEARNAELQRLLRQQIAQAQALHQTQPKSLSQEAFLAHKKAQALSRRRATLAAKKLVKEAEAQRELQALAAEPARAGEEAAEHGARLAGEAQAERERAELAAFLHIDLKLGSANAQPLNLASIHLPPAPQTPALDLGALGDLSQVLAKVTQSSRQPAPEPEALDLHSVVKAAQGRR